MKLNEMPPQIVIQKEIATFSEVLYKQLQTRILNQDSLLSTFTSPKPMDLLKLLVFSCTIEPVPQSFLDDHLDLNSSNQLTAL